ncbi:hypothetical protein F4781DRAFT_435651 [Annulohypoxylon bovei var. microspora]|nr:hypothetical protein F4781DRAFT_435651 [Annulohypoxylon bovei var. microspora]
MSITLNNYLLDDRNRSDPPDTQPRCSGTLHLERDEETSSATSLNSQALIESFQWTANNLPIGISYGDRLRIPTPGFMKELTDTPVKLEDDDQVSIVEFVNLPETAGSPGIRRSPRNNFEPRVSFPCELPIWAILATDFISITFIPSDAVLWCPSCKRRLTKESFGITPTSKIPVETCIECRKGQTRLPGHLAICWSAPSDHEGCGRLLPRSYFSGFYDFEAYTGIFCHDCRSFGHSRARLEGRYNKAK